MLHVVFLYSFSYLAHSLSFFGTKIDDMTTNIEFYI